MTSKTDDAIAATSATDRVSQKLQLLRRELFEIRDLLDPECAECRARL